MSFTTTSCKYIGIGKLLYTKTQFLWHNFEKNNSLCYKLYLEKIYLCEMSADLCIHPILLFFYPYQGCLNTIKTIRCLLCIHPILLFFYPYQGCLKAQQIKTAKFSRKTNALIPLVFFLIFAVIPLIPYLEYSQTLLLILPEVLTNSPFNPTWSYHKLSL